MSHLIVAFGYPPEDGYRIKAGSEGRLAVYDVLIGPRVDGTICDVSAGYLLAPKDVVDKAVADKKPLELDLTFYFKLADDIHREYGPFLFYVLVDPNLVTQQFQIGWKQLQKIVDDLREDTHNPTGLPIWILEALDPGKYRES